jgi:hypothetical protein
MPHLLKLAPADHLLKSMSAICLPLIAAQGTDLTGEHFKASPPLSGT